MDNIIKKWYYRIYSIITVYNIVMHQFSMVYGRYSLVDGRRSMVNGQWVLGNVQKRNKSIGLNPYGLLPFLTVVIYIYILYIYYAEFWPEKFELTYLSAKFQTRGFFIISKQVQVLMDLVRYVFHLIYIITDFGLCQFRNSPTQVHR